MKVCPYCSAQNQDQAVVCFYCRSDLAGVTSTPPAPADTPDPTQPRQAIPPRPAGASDTQRMHGQRRASAYSNTYTDPYGQSPAGSSPYTSMPSGSPPGGTTQPAGAPIPSNTSTQPYYGQQPPAAPPQYAPYPSQTAAPRQSTPLWPVLIVSLGLILLCVGGFAIWTISNAAAGGIGSLGNRAATQAAGLFTDPTTLPVAATPVPFDTPTPWPTFTFPPVDTQPPPADTPVPNETDSAAVTKLLSPECAGALEHLESVSGQITENPTVPLNADWRTELSQAISDMKMYCGSLDNASPVPGIVEEAQRNLALANSEFDQATTLFNEGVETLSPGKLLESAQHIGKASEHLRIALAELRKIGQ